MRASPEDTAPDMRGWRAAYGESDAGPFLGSAGSEAPRRQDLHRLSAQQQGREQVAAFSARARSGMGVSMPVAWEELREIKAADQWTIHSAVQRQRSLRGSMAGVPAMQTRADHRDATGSRTEIATTTRERNGRRLRKTRPATAPWRRAGSECVRDEMRQPISNLFTRKSKRFYIRVNSG
jgi:hypothetical protein